MRNYSEAERWMKDARDYFNRDDRCFGEKDWRGAIQNAQLTIELSAKALITLFEEPDWTHTPDSQLKEIIEIRKDELTSKLGSPLIDTLISIADDVKIAAPWHGWSVYGREKEDGMGWISAVDLCTEDVAKDLVARAQRCISIIAEFLKSFSII